VAREDAQTGLTGGCQCGAVRYRLAKAPSRANVCHCRMCQKASGAPFMAFAALNQADLDWTRGAPKTFASSAVAERGFCAECGTPLSYHAFEGEWISVTIASLDDPSAIAPTAQFVVEAKYPWLDDLSAMKVVDLSRWRNPATLHSRQHPDHDT